MKKLVLILWLTFPTTMLIRAQVVLIAGWDFTNTSNGGTAAAVAPGAPLAYKANVGLESGSASIYLDGSNGSSVWTSSSSNPQVTAFAGTTVNGGAPFSSVTATASLTLANSSANGNAITFAFSMAGYQSLVVSYASQRTSTGFTGNQWAYSTDGTNFTDSGGSVVPSASFSTITLGTITALDNDPTVWLRYTLNGASSITGNNRLDNIQFNATVIPEPATCILLGTGLGGVLWIRRRNQKKRTSPSS